MGSYIIKKKKNQANNLLSYLKGLENYMRQKVLVLKLLLFSCDLINFTEKCCDHE